MDHLDTSSNLSSADRLSEQADARARAGDRRAALRRRARRIRRSVAAFAAALFCAAFLMVYVQLASGHDPEASSGVANPASTSSDLG